jgi:hypothetical protein
VRPITLRSVAVGWLLSAAFVAVDCSSDSTQHAGIAGATSGPDASPGGQGGVAQGMPQNTAGSANEGGASAGLGGVSGAAAAGAGTVGAAGASAGAAGEGDTPDAGPEPRDGSSDAASTDAANDSSEGAGEAGGAGAPGDDGTDSGLPRDAGTPPIDCSVPDEPTVPAGDAGVGTRAQVQGIVTGRCVYCHSLPTPPMGLVLTDVEAVVGSQSAECSTKLRIKAGSAQDSYLVDKLLGGSQTHCGCFMNQRMPLDDDPLDDSDLNIIVSWINAGAH